jgi:hydroxymethylpyrimidine/phosphomethylpyrimidine kinase
MTDVTPDTNPEPATPPPIALTIAGSDSGGGAGIQADLKTFSALGVYGASVITALTAQNTRGVTGIHDCPPEMVSAQMTAVLSDLDVKAIKIGMLSRVETIRAVAETLKAYPYIPVVLDPVMVATSGDRLIVPEAEEAIVRELFPLVNIITPNLAEAAQILKEPMATSVEEQTKQAERLVDLGAPAALVKGGHGTGDEAVDILATQADIATFAAPRLVTNNTHGTGCTLSSAIAAHLAMGFELMDAVQSAKDYVTAALEASDRLVIGQGHGPVHHFHAWW